MKLALIILLAYAIGGVSGAVAVVVWACREPRGPRPDSAIDTVGKGPLGLD